MLYYNSIEPDTHMVKNWKDFRWFSSTGTAMDKIVNVTNNEFIWILRDASNTWHNWHMYNDGKEILYNT